MRWMILCGCILLGACGSERGLYHWDYYEDSVYHVVSEKQDTDLKDDIRRISAEIEWARDHGFKSPPGIHAHLGYLYYVTGSPDGAVQEFNTEKQLYPQSARFVDGMLRRMKS